MTRTRGNKGSTLIEIVIVVIILGILAAIVLPQFSSASPAVDDNGFSEMADSQKIGNASGIPQPDENVSFADEAAARRVSSNDPQLNGSKGTTPTAKNPSHQIENMSARTDESR